MEVEYYRSFVPIMREVLPLAIVRDPLSTSFLLPLLLVTLLSLLYSVSLVEEN